MYLDGPPSMQQLQIGVVPRRHITRYLSPPLVVMVCPWCSFQAVRNTEAEAITSIQHHGYRKHPEQRVKEQ